MKSSWFWLAWIVAAAVLLAACGGGAQQEAPPTPEEIQQAVEEEAARVQEEAEAEAQARVETQAAAFDGLPDAELEQPSEFDVAMVYEGPTVPEDTSLTIDSSLLPPPRALQGGAPPATAANAADADDSIIYAKANEFEEGLARIEAAPQPVAAAPEFEIVYFDFDRSNIKPEFEAAISRNAAKLREDPSRSVLIEGHCDERGTTEYNLALGERRARAVMQALISAGVSASQLRTVSYGEERPVAFGHNEASWWQNRRAAITSR